MRATTADDIRAMDRGKLRSPVLAGWVVPGAGHLLQRRLAKGLVFLFVLPLMFGLGLLLDGTLFPLAPLSQSLLTTGAALAERCLGAALADHRARRRGPRQRRRASYEYGWVFMVVSGLLNCLVILDAFDIGMGRK